MKALWSLLFFYPSLTVAAIESIRENEYVAPTDQISTMRGGLTVCRSTNPQGNSRLSFLQIGEGRCPPEPRTAEGFDRPAYEMDSPGIPFKNKGLE